MKVSLIFTFLATISNVTSVPWGMKKSGPYGGVSQYHNPHAVSDDYVGRNRYGEAGFPAPAGRLLSEKERRKAAKYDYGYNP